MRSHGSALRSLIVAAATLFASSAHAECPPGQTPASCALHEEGVAFFLDGKFDAAATKFRAAIGAGPTARSYLGYSQAVEAQGKVALAYETMTVAKRLSDEEMRATGGKDPEITARAERIKYKLGELGGKIAYVWLRLPQGIPASRVVSVHREREGDLADPLGRWIVIAPERQVLFATLDDGRRVEMIAQVPAGTQGQLVLPIVPMPAVTQPVRAPAGRPLIELYRKAPKPPPPNPPNAVFAIEMVTIARAVGNVGYGLGFGLFYERKFAKRIAGTVRTSIVFHPTQTYDGIGVGSSREYSATEGVLMIGARTRAKLPVYAGLELGALLYSQSSRHFGQLPSTDFEETYAWAYPALAVGGGARLGRLHLDASVLGAIDAGSAISMPVRFMFTVGLDMVKR